MKGLWALVHQKGNRPLLGWLEGGLALIFFSLSSTSFAQFSVSQFSPSPSYSISAGPMMISDFNGDGMSDVIQVDRADVAHLIEGQLTASILICSLSDTPALEDCNHSNAVSVLDMREPFNNPIMCMMHGQAFLAGTEIGRRLEADERVKIICTRRISKLSRPAFGRVERPDEK
jgi:hypothetical protein